MGSSTRQKSRTAATGADKGPALGRLYLVATPIGNLEDITYRAVRILREVDLVAAEDTRSARVLFTRHQISTRTVSLFDGNERARTPMLVQRLEAGESVAVISEAGTPLLSDPGLPLVRACLERSIPVDAIPGPSAITTALLLSGFAPARFRFTGFLPRRGGARRRLLASIAADSDAVVIFESPRRLAATLAELAELLGQRHLAVIREMTKVHQEVRRGTAEQLLETLKISPARGEVTVVVSELQQEASQQHDEGLAQLVRNHLASGDSPRQTAQQLGELGFSKRTAYQLALKLSQTECDADGVDALGQS